ncbi:13121_t:CDS:2 [Cetraspora pellucida]|uniref:13121_t:CDS:1 n=1 Tax=Cetraspora pellucida TaxID=1433469 RepID=A0ACA9LBH0_9GLOM|nr:13121_t:CDS:2 [Cetraspora pellucida]
MNIANFSNNHSGSMMDMEQYIFFDDAECSMTTNVNNASNKDELIDQFNVDLEKRDNEVEIISEDIPIDFGEKYRPNKNQVAAHKGKQKNTKTKKVNCPWHVNLSYREAETSISITTFVNKHNHNIHIETQEFGVKYHTLTEDVLKEVEIMMKHRNLTITLQHNLLKEHFPDLHFLDSDLANSIQKFKTKDYLLHTLHPCSRLWAHAYLSKIFTARIESTAWIEETEAQWNRYNQYKNSTTFATVPAVGHDLFPTVIKTIDKYLTEAIIVTFHILMILPQWYQDSYQENIKYKNKKIIFIHGKEITNEECSSKEMLVQRPSIVPAMTPVATLLAVDDDDNEIEKPPSRSNKMDINMNEDQTRSEKTSDSYSDDEISDGQDISIQVPQNIQNPSRVKGKRRPPKSRFKSSIEEQSQKETSRGVYKYKQCDKVGHNSAYYKRKRSN